MKCYFRKFTEIKKEGHEKTINEFMAECEKECPYYDGKAPIMQGPHYYSFCMKVRNECIVARKQNNNDVSGTIKYQIDNGKEASK